MSKILILEDDESIRSMIKVNLIRHGYEVVEARTGEDAIVAYQDQPDIEIAILDVMLPYMNGYEVCERLRSKNAMLGIMMLTAKSQEQDKIIGLESGADDYLTKPFSPLELIARIKALHRRIKVSEDKFIEEIIKEGPFELNINTRRCFIDGQEVVLTPTEFMMLKIFIKSKHVTLSREELLEKIWGENFYGDVKIVDVNIRRLRRKIENDPSTPKHIETIWGKGYKWKG